MLLEVPPAGVCAFCRLLFVLRPYDVAFPVQHDQVAAEHEGKIEVSRKLGRSFDGNLGEPVRHHRRFRRGGGQSEAAPDGQRKGGRRHEDRFSYSVHRYILPFLCKQFSEPRLHQRQRQQASEADEAVEDQGREEVLRLFSVRGKEEDRANEVVDEKDHEATDAQH